MKRAIRGVAVVALLACACGAREAAFVGAAPTPEQGPCAWLEDPEGLRTHLGRYVTESEGRARLRELGIEPETTVRERLLRQQCSRDRAAEWLLDLLAQRCPMHPLEPADFEFAFASSLKRCAAESRNR